MISRRLLEVTTAVLTGAFGVAIVVSSLDNGIGWSSAGVDAGTFPFLTGAVILAGSLINLVRGAWQAHAVAISRMDLRHLAGLFVPAAVFIGAIPFIGIYLASGGYVFGTFALQKRRSVVHALMIAVATPVALYVVFERTFQVSLPHGALADMLGF